MRRTRDNTLTAYWNKPESDLMFCHPSGPQTKTDAHMLYGALAYEKLVNGRTLRDELERRGYDITTLRFSICKKAGHERWKLFHREPVK